MSRDNTEFYTRFCRKIFCCSSGAQRTSRTTSPASTGVNFGQKDYARRGCCIRMLKWFPVAFVTLILIWAYYAYIVQFCYFTLIAPTYESVDIPRETSTKDNSTNNNNNTPEISASISQSTKRHRVMAQAIAYALVFNLLFLMMVWSYLSVTFMGFFHAPNGSSSNKKDTFGRNRRCYTIPDIYKLSPGDLNELENAREEGRVAQILNGLANRIITRHTNELEDATTIKPLKLCTIQGGPRYCDVCKVIKPDRTHHCAACGRCVLKMDHHCPWVNNCTHYANYKQFLLFLSYGALLCLFVGITTLPYFISFWTNSDSYQIPSSDAAYRPAQPLPQVNYISPVDNLDRLAVKNPDKAVDSLKMQNNIVTLSSLSTIGFKVDPDTKAVMGLVKLPNPKNKRRSVENNDDTNNNNNNDINNKLDDKGQNSNNAVFKPYYRLRAALEASSTSFKRDSVSRALLTTRFNVLFLFFISLMFGISLFALAIYHCYLVSKNRTTLEAFQAPIFRRTPTADQEYNGTLVDYTFNNNENHRNHHDIDASFSNQRDDRDINIIAINGNAAPVQGLTRPDKNGFNLGSCISNFQQVFGYQYFKWPIPIFSAPGDGALYPTRDEFYAQSASRSHHFQNVGGNSNSSPPSELETPQSTHSSATFLPPKKIERFYTPTVQQNHTNAIGGGRHLNPNTNAIGSYNNKKPSSDRRHHLSNKYHNGLDLVAQNELSQNSYSTAASRNPPFLSIKKGLKLKNLKPFGSGKLHKTLEISHHDSTKFIDLSSYSGHYNTSTKFSHKDGHLIDHNTKPILYGSIENAYKINQNQNDFPPSHNNLTSINLTSSPPLVSVNLQ